ncbi:hypothetical protein F4782DRAFT_547332 [Xylaria castorea]|nr:hypothetical protein F4782DRAFT_547332 [Xylaria castorea]
MGHQFKFDFYKSIKELQRGYFIASSFPSSAHSTASIFLSYATSPTFRKSPATFVFIMKLLATLCYISLAAFGAALPTDTVPNGPSNVLSPVQSEHITPALIEGQEPYVMGASERNVTVSLEGEEARLNKRATLIVDIWGDINQGGRHEGLTSDTQRCYNLGNGWNDQVSSLSVPSGFGCIFYQNSNCGSGDFRLTVTGAYYVSNLGDYGFNDIVTSYLCYN